MVKYHNGKIYKIQNETNNIYIGSCCISLKDRYYRHTDKNNKCSSKKIINENSEIVLIENYSCESKKELLMREQYWIDYYRNKTEYNVVNEVNSYLTEEEYLEMKRESRRQYGLNNKDKIKELNRRYRENNKEKVKEINRLYRENNRDKLNSEEMKEYRKQYELNNRDKLNKKRREYKDRDKEKWREYNKLYQKELYYMKKFGNVMSEFLEMLDCY